MSVSMLVACGLRLLLSLSALAWVWGAAAARARRVAGPRPWDVEACDVAIRVAALLTVSALALGALGWLTAPAWLAAAGLTGALLHLLPSRAQAPPATSDAGAGPSPIFLVALAGFLLGRAVFGLRNPPADWDSLQYHLPMVAHWIQSHALDVAVREPQAFGTYYPGGGELLQLWAALSTGRETLMTWPGILALGVMALALRRLSLLIGARAGVAEALALALVTAPGVGGLTLGTRIDNLLAAEMAVALLFAMRYLNTGARGDLASCLLALGLVAGTKANGPVLAALAVVLTLIEGARRGRPARDFSIGLLAIPLVLGGFWLARNLILAGNPLYPSEVRLGTVRLPGLESFEVLSRTTQIAVWREGFAGHLTLHNLGRFFGPGPLLVVLGLLPALVRAFAPGGMAPARGARPLALFAIAGALLFLISPFSGAYWPAEHGQPPGLNWDNLRYLLPAVVAALPLAAVGLSGRLAPAVIALLAGAILWDVRRWAGHVFPGVALAALVAVITWVVRRARRGGDGRTASWIGHRAWLGAAGTVVASAALALAVTAVEGKREQLTDRIWDGYLPRIHDLRAGDLRALRDEARGRAIAVVGMDAWWGYYGRAFGGNPVYVPVGLAAPASRRWSFARDDRAHADSALWRRNLAARGARFVVVGAFGGACDRVPIERRWMESDPAHFRRIAGSCCGADSRPASPDTTTGCDEAWRVMDAAEAAARVKH